MIEKPLKAAGVELRNHSCSTVRLLVLGLINLASPAQRSLEQGCRRLFRGEPDRATMLAATLASSAGSAVVTLLALLVALVMLIGAGDAGSAGGGSAGGAGGAYVSPAAIASSASIRPT
jgi:hypothetical protein